jgi:hypothetical protein
MIDTNEKVRVYIVCRENYIKHNPELIFQDAFFSEQAARAWLESCIPFQNAYTIKVYERGSDGKEIEIK